MSVVCVQSFNIKTIVSCCIILLLIRITYIANAYACRLWKCTISPSTALMRFSVLLPLLPTMRILSIVICYIYYNTLKTAERQICASFMWVDSGDNPGHLDLMNDGFAGTKDHDHSWWIRRVAGVRVDVEHVRLNECLPSPLLTTNLLRINVFIKLALTMMM